MTSKKKIAASVGAVGLAAVIALGGTFAWQSISQQALNETMATINPGGRLHDDFNGSNKDVYVENFTEDGTAIFAAWTSTWRSARGRDRTVRTIRPSQW